ncbi:MAG: N-acetylmuramoyl-L-alanine amidase [Candidatus Hydrothermia bacterium]|nr:N-acetylmuramoyl-L-alanine amidase [Candidatus Hydrothermia bacterium]HOL24382.1 N-acetylmuramoyl-L-alanine amidase [Candidatus Hydrothermia bacterium]HPO79361.1 N-acetylmuramoyl-L-alanine amidase [Candidatus Hydrothermia bacterium]
MKHFLISLAFPCALFAWTICLDPGHGGTDPGAIGTYYTEKQANLDVANWAKFYMDKVGGITWTSMTRYSDMDVSLEDRVNYANTNDFDRFISIHQNAYNGSVQGTETYCYTYGSAQSFALRDSTHPELVRAYLYNDRGAQTAGYYFGTQVCLQSLEKALL